MPKLTYFPLIMDRWTAGTRHLTYEQKGFYIDLLLWMFETGKPVKNVDHAAKILCCDPRTSRRLLADLSGKFRQTSGGLRHKLVDELIRNGGKIRGLQPINFPIDPDPDPDPDKGKEKTAKAVQKKAANRGSRLPEDWTPSQAETEWATREFPQLDQRLETDKFRDYWLSVPGQRGCKLSWARTWRNWLRNAKQTTRKVNGDDNYDKPIRGSYDWYAEKDRRREQERERLDGQEAERLLEGDDGVVWEKLED